MADNRLFLTCTICGERLYLGGALGGSGAYYHDYDDMPLEEKLNDFYQSHIWHDNGDNIMGTNFFIEHERHSGAEIKALMALYLAFSQDD